jgi:DNA-binding NtrC family response regulator
MSEKSTSILVVDDEPRVLELCARMLSNAGYVVTAAGDAKQARRYLDDERFDLVILDIHMPDEDGISLLKHVHRIDPKTPAMLITGFAAVGTVVDAIRLNVREYLCKPFTMKKLLRAVEASLQATDEVRWGQS